MVKGYELNVWKLFWGKVLFTDCL